jgi:hypothetical protein
MKKQFTIPLYPDIAPEYLDNDIIPFLIENRESIFDIYFTSRIPPFNQDAMGTIFYNEDSAASIDTALYVQYKTGVPISATFNNKFISPNYQNLKIWIANFKSLYESGVRSATLPFTSWLMFGDIQREFPDLYLKNTVLWALTEPRQVYDSFINGFDYVNLDRNLMRSQEKLKLIDEARNAAQQKLGKKLRLSILYNESCVGNCPIQEEHYLYNVNNNPTTQNKVFFKSEMNSISCIKWEREDKSYGFKRANIVYDQEFLQGLEIVDVFKMHGRENRKVFENSLAIVSHFDTNTHLVDEFQILKSKYNVSDEKWQEWLKTIRNCNFDCWKCKLCDSLIQ